MSPLKRHRVLIQLSHDHHQSLLIAQMLKTNASAYLGMPTDLQGKMQYLHLHFVMHLMPHFDKEENILFPFIEKRDIRIDAIVSELMEEHATLMHDINSLPHLAQPEPALDRIGRLLERHIRKEERELFELIQEIFSEDELMLLETKMHTAENQSGK